MHIFKTLIFAVLLLIGLTAYADPKLTITVANPNLALNQSTTVTFTFSEAVTGFTESDIHIVPSANAAMVGGLTTVNASTYTISVIKNQAGATSINVDNNSYLSVAGGLTGHGSNAGINPTPIYYVATGGTYNSKKEIAVPQPACLLWGEKLITTATGVKATPVVEQFYMRKYSVNTNAFGMYPIPQDCLIRPGVGQSIVADTQAKPSDLITPHGAHNHGTLMPKINVRQPTKVTGTNDIRIWAGNSDQSWDASGNCIGGHCDMAGALRFNFLSSHQDNVDPIVYPGIKGSAHLHMFFGNTAIDKDTNNATIKKGPSTAQGGAGNRTGYWSPVMVDTSTQTAKFATNVQVYYKAGANGVRYTEPLPDGLKIVAGNPSGNSAETGKGSFRCFNRTTNNQSATTNYIPSCKYPAYTSLEFIVDFPNCVADNGSGGMVLDSVNHISHLVDQFNPSIPLYPSTGSTQYGSNHPVTGSPVGRNWCPQSHPHLITRIQQFATYAIEPGEDTATWRLSSDNYSYALPGGYSAHADWWMGWDRNVLNRWHNNCNKSPIDCGTGYIGLNEGVAISAISVSGSTVTITTATPHRLKTNMINNFGVPFTLLGRISGITGTEAEKFNYNPLDPRIYRTWDDMYEGPQSATISVAYTPLTILNATQIQYQTSSAPSSDAVASGLNLTNAKIQWGEQLCNLNEYCPSEYYKHYYPAQ